MNSRAVGVRARWSRLVGSAAAVVMAAGALVAISAPAHAADAVDPIVAPSVSGDCVVFGTRTLDPGQWPDGYDVSAQWYNKRGNNPADRYGQPGLVKKLSAVLTPSPTGNGRTVLFYPQLTVTKRSDGSSFVWSGDLSCQVQAAPANTLVSPPVIEEGEVRVGETVKMTLGEWAETDGWTFTTNWGDSRSFTFNRSNIDREYTYVVTARKEGHAIARASVTVGPVGKGKPPVPVVAPSVTGTAKVGSTITPSYGTWNHSGLSYLCHWYRDGERLGTCGPLTLTPADLGKKYNIRVIAQSPGTYEPSAPVASAAVTIAPGPAPTPSRPPAINGTTTVGQTITLDQGQWNPPAGAKFGFQWLRDGVPVAQRTSAAYALGPDDAGKRLSVAVTVTTPGYETTTVTTSPTAPVGKGPRPAMTEAPRISGKALVGSTLTASPGKWSQSGLSFKYTWLRDGAVIDGATGSTYRPVAADLGTSISVRVTVTSVAWSTTTGTSSGTSKIGKGAAPVASKVPTISGTAKVGSRLSVNNGTWTVPNLTYTYQWFSNGVAIPQATASTYTLKSAQQGKKITVKVIVSRTGYETGAAITAPTAEVR
jgi:hypothetical protein